MAEFVRFGVDVDERLNGTAREGTPLYENLKAVVVKAKKVLPQPANKEAWKPAHKRALATIMDGGNVTAPNKGGLSVYGTNVLMNITNTMGALPTNNSRTTTFGDGAERISGEYVRENLLVEEPTCHACPVACKKMVEVKDGPFKGLKMESFEYEPAWSLGANCGNDDANSIAKMIDMANDHGFDAIEIGGILSALMEATERGKTAADENLKWGDVDGMIAMIGKTVRREGIGDVLADGVEPTARHFDAPEIGMHVKNQGLPAYDPRGLKGMGIAYATSNRGACHLRAYTPASELGLIPMKTDPLEWKGKGELTKLMQDLHAFSDSLDLCKFSAFAEGAEEYAEQYGAIVGVPFTVDDVLAAGERIYNLERRYNNLAGFGPGSDTLPERYTKEPSTEQGSKGHVCELDEMLAEYYAARGWKNGVVPEEKLAELGVT